MSDQPEPTPEQPEVVLDAAAPLAAQEPEPGAEAVHSPAKVIRIGAMVRQLLEEVRQAPLDEASRSRLREIYKTTVEELGGVLSAELREELDRLTLPFDTHRVPSDSELRIAHAQLVGWLEGLFHGIQAMLFAQQAQSRAQLEEMRRHSLPPGPGGEGGPGEGGPGQYL